MGIEIGRNVEPIRADIDTLGIYLGGSTRTKGRLKFYMNMEMLINRMGKTRDLFKKIRDTKVTFHAKMGTKKDRNNMDLTEAEDIKKRWKEYTEELYKKRCRNWL